MFDGVVCPDFIREQWRERLIIDLDPSYPLDLIESRRKLCQEVVASEVHDAAPVVLDQ